MRAPNKQIQFLPNPKEYVQHASSSYLLLRGRRVRDGRRSENFRVFELRGPVRTPEPLKEGPRAST